MSNISNHPEAAETTATNQERQLPLSSDQFVTQDPIFRLLHEKLGAPLTVILNILFAGLVFLADVLREAPAERPFEVLASVRKLLIISFGLSVYFLLPRWIADLFNGLRSNRVIGKSRGNYNSDDFQNETVKRIDKRICSALGLTFVVVFWIHRILTYSHKRSLWLEVVALVFVYALPYYAYLVSIVKFCLALFSTKRLLDMFDVKVSPLHVDGVGGFRPMGRMLLRYAVVLAIFVSLATVGRVLSYHDHSLHVTLNRSEVYMAVAAFALFPMFLWGWLWVPHKAMIEYRDGKLGKLAEELQKVDGDKEAELLAGRKEKYKVAKESYPTWPMSFHQVRNFLGLTMTPLIATITTVVVQYLWAKITKP